MLISLAQTAEVSSYRVPAKVDIIIPADMLIDIDEIQLSYILEDIEWLNKNHTAGKVWVV